jgi:hypothetical protein
MMASALIEKLRAAIEQHGDLPVQLGYLGAASDVLLCDAEGVDADADNPPTDIFLT